MLCVTRQQGPCWGLAHHRLPACGRRALSVLRGSPLQMGHGQVCHYAVLEEGSPSGSHSATGHLDSRLPASLGQSTALAVQAHVWTWGHKGR